MTTIPAVRSPWAPDPSSRPTSPSTRFAPTLCHSATWASPPSDRSVLAPRFSRAAQPVTSSRITIASGDFVPVRQAVDRVSSDRRGPVTTPIVVAPLYMSVMSVIPPAPQPPRPFTSNCSGVRLGSSPSATSPRSCRPSRYARRPHRRSAFASPGAGFARHRLLHHALHSCPRLCGRRRQRAPHLCRHRLQCSQPSAGSARRLRRHRTTRCRRPRCARPRHRPPHYPLHLCPGQCSRLRQCARHDRLHYLPHSPPLNRRGGSLRRVLRRPFPFACAPGFFVPDRLRGLWFSHRTQLAAGVAQARACHAPFSVFNDIPCQALAGPSGFSGEPQLWY